MEKKKMLRVRGSALITPENDVYFTPYRKKEKDELPWKVMAITLHGKVKETENVRMFTLSYPKKERFTQSEIVREFVQLLTKIL